MVIVIENGTYQSRNGMAGEDGPRSIHPTIAGTPVFSHLQSDSREECYGEDAAARRGTLRIHNPIEKGVITDWPTLEGIWNYTFTSDLRLSPAEHGVLVAASILNPLEHLRKIAEVMFETFHARDLCVAFPEFLALLSLGKTTGCLVDIGQDVTRIVPVIEKKVITDAVDALDIGGNDITLYLRRLLGKAGFSFTDGVWEVLDFVRDVKEHVCYVSEDPARELEKFRKSRKLVPYTGSNREDLQFGPEIFLAPECLFDSALAGKSGKPLATAVADAIQQCEAPLQPVLFANIFLAGGTSALRGLKERLEGEIQTCAPRQFNVRVQSVQDPRIASWVGGSILATVPDYQHVRVTPGDYLETGLKFF